ncbi:hypothetical protein QYF36_019977 [Acer negundo]|nr:hypothetical protein QYF36_019977 [Acer negundo]
MNVFSDIKQREINSQHRHPPWWVKVPERLKIWCRPHRACQTDIVSNPATLKMPISPKNTWVRHQEKPSDILEAMLAL